MNLKEIHNDIQKQENLLSKLTREKENYSPIMIRKKLKGLADMYFTSGEASNPSGLNGIKGMHFAPVGMPDFVVNICIILFPFYVS